MLRPVLALNSIVSATVCCNPSCLLSPVCCLLQTQPAQPAQALWLRVWAPCRQHRADATASLSSCEETDVQALGTTGVCVCAESLFCSFTYPLNALLNINLLGKIRMITSKNVSWNIVNSGKRRFLPSFTVIPPHMYDLYDFWIIIHWQKKSIFSSSQKE